MVLFVWYGYVSAFVLHLSRFFYFFIHWFTCLDRQKKKSKKTADKKKKSELAKPPGGGKTMRADLFTRFILWFNTGRQERGRELEIDWEKHTHAHRESNSILHYIVLTHPPTHPRVFFFFLCLGTGDQKANDSDSSSSDDDEDDEDEEEHAKGAPTGQKKA